MNDLWTVDEVAQRLRVDAITVRRWIKQGALNAITLPHKGTRRVYRITQTTLNALLYPGNTSEVARHEWIEDQHRQQKAAL